MKTYQISFLVGVVCLAWRPSVGMAAFILGWTLFWYLITEHHERRKKQQNDLWNELNAQKWNSDDYVVSQITQFEVDLRRNKDLPDAVRGVDAYVFRYLMRDWFSELIARHRHNDDLARRLRQDMAEYMESLSHSRTASFLSFESRTEEARTKYEAEFGNLRKKFLIIEQSFALQIGRDAPETLKESRDAPHGRYDDDGTPAPPGYRYLLNRLVPENQRNWLS